jgi:homoaconitate hydratase
MAQVVMENYDPEFAKLTRPKDILVGGFNFGTGSSREQAVTALQAKGIALVIAGSFSQTYLRNAFNNGYPCVESPQLVARLREELAAKIAAGERTIIPGDAVAVDFTSGTIAWGEGRYPFSALGRVAQSLVVAGGVENLIRHKLGLS